MSLNYIPGVNEITLPLSAAASATKQAVGENNYGKLHSAGTYLYSASIGFLPTMPIIWPVQIALFILATLILIFIFNISPGHSLLYAYIMQGIIITIFAQRIIDRLLLSSGI